MIAPSPARHLAILLCLLLSLHPDDVHAQSARDLDQLLKRLEELAQKRTQNKEAELRRVLPQVQQAASNGQAAVNAFTDAYRNIVLAGRTSQASEFQSWRDSNRDVLSSNEFRAAAQLHARYLELTLRRSASDNPEEFVQPSLDYLNGLADAWSKLFARQERASQLQQQLLNGSVRDGLMAKNWQLAPFLPNLTDWEFSPGNAEGILEKNVRPFLRNKKNRRVLETWDWQMRFEESQFPLRDRSHAYEMFQKRRLPDLQMRRAEERANLGEPLEAVRDALNVLTKFPEHPSFDEWVQKARDWANTARSLSNPPAAETAQPSDESEPSDAPPAPGSTP